LIALRNDLQAGNTAAIAATDHPALAKDEDNFLFHISANGTLQAQLTATNNLAAQHGNRSRWTNFPEPRRRHRPDHHPAKAGANRFTPPPSRAVPQSSIFPSSTTCIDKPRAMQEAPYL